MVRSTTSSCGDSIEVENSALAKPGISFTSTVTRLFAGAATTWVIGAPVAGKNVSVATVSVVPGLRRASRVLKQADVAPSAR